MKLEPLHAWDLSPKAAVALQRELAPNLISDAPLDAAAISTVAGVDVSVRSGLSRAAVAVLSYPELDLLEITRAEQETRFPYVPGLLAFREGPVIAQALEKLGTEPDVFLFDGMGQMHPRRMGIAAHLGLWLQRPTIGCGKSHYIGEYQQPGPRKGSHAPVRYHGEQVGVVLRTRSNVKPLYVSVGHRAELQSAIELVLSCTPRYRLPLPIRKAHAAAGQW